MFTFITPMRLLAVLSLILICDVHAQSTGPLCPSIQTAQDIIDCLKTKHPNYKAATELRSAEADSRSAGSRWLNPEIQSQSSFGRTLGSDRMELQVALVQPIQTGGKRGAQKLLGEGNALSYNAQSRLAQGDLLRSTVIKLYRYKQVGLELAAIQEASDVFNKLVNQYQSRGRLTPEQEVSLSIFKLAQSEYELRLLETRNEEIEIKNYFVALLDIDISQLKHILPSFLEPSLQEISTFKPKSIAETSPETLLAKSDALKSLAAASQARGDAFSDISFGPMLGFNREAGIDETLVGLTLTIPFPIWNQNGYTVAAASKEANLKEAQASLTVKNVENELSRLISYIETAKVTLSKLPSKESVNQKHVSVERQFFRGLVSPALMIEAHRALVDFLTQRHLTENKITDTVWHLYIEADRANEKRIEGKK